MGLGDQLQTSDAVKHYEPSIYIRRFGHYLEAFTDIEKAKADSPRGYFDIAEYDADSGKFVALIFLNADDVWERQEGPECDEIERYE